MNFSFLNKKQIREHRFYVYAVNKQKYAPLLFFIGGFLWDWLTLGRVDRLYDMILLSTYFVILSLCIHFYSTIKCFNWKQHVLKTFLKYLPLAIQFFLGGLTSAYIIYFSRSVSLSKTASFFVILIALYVANELFKKRISNLYLQFGIYSFVSFTFFAYIIPVLVAKMNPLVFVCSGLLSLSITLLLIVSIYNINRALTTEIPKLKLLGLVLFVYALVVSFYFLKLIPPVPLALNESYVAYDLKTENNEYKVTYKPNNWYIFWRSHNNQINLTATQKVYVYTSIFAPTDLNKKVYHQWKKYNSKTGNWDLTDKIGFTITGGRKNGYRGYTYKQNLREGKWEVEVVTEEGLIIGIVDFELQIEPQQSQKLKTISL